MIDWDHKFGSEKTYGVDEVKPPGVVLVLGMVLAGAKGLESDGVGVGVEGKSALDRHVHDHETLATKLVGEDLDGVADEETGPGERVENAKDPDEEDHGLVGALGALLTVQGGCESPEDEGAEHTTGGSEEESAAINLVNEKSHPNGDDEGKASLAG